MNRLSTHCDPGFTQEPRCIYMAPNEKTNKSFDWMQLRLGLFERQNQKQSMNNFHQKCSRLKINFSCLKLASNSLKPKFHYMNLPFLDYLSLYIYIYLFLQLCPSSSISFFRKKSQDLDGCWTHHQPCAKHGKLYGRVFRSWGSGTPLRAEIGRLA